jgi:hypothetical protein
LTGPDREDEFPTVGCAADGRIWVAWISWDGRRDEVLVRALDSPETKPISATAQDCWRPAMAADNDGRLWVTWAQNDNGNWDLWACFLRDGQWSGPQRLTTNGENDFGQRLAVDNQGRVWMAWQAVVSGNYEILAARITPQGLAGTQNISQHPANDWEPAIAADQQGRVVVGWDSYRYGSYDIFVAQVADGTEAAPRLIAATNEYEAHAAVAFDQQDRFWIAWDSGGPDWGQHGEPRARLHSRRSVHLACLTSADLLAAPLQDLSPALSPALTEFCELPELRVDGSGRLWLLLRHLEDVTPPRSRPAAKKQPQPQQPRGIWNPYALYYADGQWSSPLKLPDSNGRNDMRVATCLDRSGKVWAAWADDGRSRTRAEEPVNHNVHVAELAGPAGQPANLPVAAPARPLPAANPLPLARENRPRRAITVGNATYELLYGDLHRHTDISRCAMNYDGSLLDTYRYAIDAAGLDFLGISDHDQDLLKHRYERTTQGPLQDYAWWRSQKYCDLFHIPGRFLALYGYEHGGSFQARGGHKNVLFLQRGQPCYEQDSPEELFHVLQGTEAVVIPHQLADGGSATDWGKWNAGYERVAEIFQTRGSYEFLGAPRMAAVQRPGNYLQDALGNDVRVGVIASSDHGMMHGAYAGVYVTECTRRGVLEALRCRRSFGITETIVLDFRLGDRFMGEEVVVRERPAFQATVTGKKPLELVEVVRDGLIVYSTKPEASSCSFHFTDNELPPGAKAYYYLRTRQQDNQWAWSSAIWVHWEAAAAK